MTHGMKDCAHIGVEDLAIDFIRLGGQRRPALLEPGIVEGGIEAAEAGHRLRHEASQMRLAGDVGRDEHAFRAGAGQSLGDLFTERMARNKRYQQFSDAEYHLELPDGPYRIARDGELGEQIDRLDARVLPRALTVITPARRKKR